MIKFYTTIVTLLALTVLGHSQTSEHLTFKGVPIDGTLSEYVVKMRKAGFLELETSGGTALLSGDFAGYKECHVGVSTLKQKDLVYKVAVIFPEKDTWSTLSGNYFDLKKMLTEKYGEASINVEKFDGYSQPRDDQRRMYEVEFDRCKYACVWQTEKGNIQLAIDHDGVTKCFVTLAYFDKINADIIKSSAKDDL